MLLLIDAELTEPPSETTLFRDVTLYATIFKGRDVILETTPEMKDFYYKWLKSHGAFDFVKDILEYEREAGFAIRSKWSSRKYNIGIRSLGYHNFNRIIRSI
ncbi:MAG: hypothetical protein CL885_03165 [Dehalococcoidia bacterium]|nr:hypothetical protein [Dehalococcoidia bacterium]